MSALNVLCAQLTSDLFAIAKFLFFIVRSPNHSQTATGTAIVTYYRRQVGNRIQAFEWHEFQ